MSERRLVPWTWAHHPEDHRLAHMFGDFRQQMNRLLEHAWHGVPLGASWAPGTIQPRADVSETDREIRISMELPGMEFDDLEVLVTRERLTIKGEKKTTEEEKGRGYHIMERSYGSFLRAFPLPPEAAADETQASFENGVLTVTLPKTTAAKRSAKKVAIKAKKKAAAAAAMKPSTKRARGRKAPAARKRAAGKAAKVKKAAK